MDRRWRISRVGLATAVAAMVAAIGAALPGAGAAAPARADAPVRALASATTTSVLFSKSTVVAGETVTLRANVFVANSTIPATGTVTFLLNGLPLASGVALSGGVATYTTSFLAVGALSIGATYAGSGVTYLGSSGSATLTVNKASTAVTITSSANPTIYGLPPTVTATVVATAPGSGTPTGTVTLSGSGLPAATLVNGSATFVYSRSTAGTTSLQAAYSGDSRYNSASSGTLEQVVNPAPVTVTITTSANPSTYFDGTIATATVKPLTAGGATPTGTLRLTPGNGTVTLSGGKATWLTRDYIPGAVTIGAVYSGDASYSNSTATSIVLNQQKATPTAEVTVSPTGTVAYGTPLTITVNLPVGSPVQRVPGGTVTVANLDGSPGAKTLAGGKATFTTTAGANPSGSYTVSYSGDSLYLPITAPAVKITLKKGASATLLSASGLPVQEGGTFTLLAEVTGPDADKGTATVYDGTTVIAGDVPVKGNLVSKAVTAGAAGKHTYRITFSGTANVEGSSGTLDVVVQPRPASEAVAGGGAAATTTAGGAKAQDGGSTKPGSTARPGTAGTTTGAKGAAPRPAAKPGAAAPGAGTPAAKAAAAKAAAAKAAAKKAAAAKIAAAKKKAAAAKKAAAKKHPGR